MSASDGNEGAAATSVNAQPPSDALAAPSDVETVFAEANKGRLSPSAEARTVEPVDGVPLREWVAVALDQEALDMKTAIVAAIKSELVTGSRQRLAQIAF